MRINKKNYSIEQKHDIRLSFYVAAFFVVSTYNSSLKQLFSVSGSVGNIMSFAVIGLLLFFLLKNLPTIFLRAGAVLVSSEICAFVSYLFSYLYGNSEFELLMEKALWTIGICIPLGVAVYSIRDKQILFDTFYRASLIMFIPLCLSLLNTNAVDKSYSMSSAYMLVLPILIFYRNYFIQKSKTNLFLAVVCTIIIIFFGSRGAVLCVGIYILLQIFILSRRGLKRIVTLVVGCGSFMVIAINYQSILLLISSFLQKYDIESYVLKNIINMNFTSSSSRKYLADYYWGLVKQKPLLGWGVTGGWIDSGMYPHNIIIEYFLSFGIVVGFVLSILTMSLYIKVFTSSRGINKDLLVIFAVYSISLFLSGSFLDTPRWFVFVFLCLAEKRGQYYRKPLT